MDTATRLDLYAVGRDYVVQRAEKIDPKVVDVDGSDVNIIVGSSSVMSFTVMKQLIFAVTNLFLDGAEKEDLDRYAWDRYNETRKGASASLGSVRLYRATFAAGGGTVPIGTKVQTINGFDYITTSVATFGATDLVSKADVRAVQAGKSSQVGANFIRKFANAGSLFDSTLQVTNDNATAGGEDVETDELFRERLRAFWRTQRRGILAAIEEGALSVPGVVSARAIEAFTGGDTPARIVALYIADSSGVASNALASQVRVALDDYRAAGIAVVIYNSLPLLASIALRLAFRANVDTEVLTSDIRAAVVSYVNSLPVSGALAVSGIYGVLLRYRALGLVVAKDSIESPTGDLIPDPGQTLRTTIDLVTATPSLALGSVA